MTANDKLAGESEPTAVAGPTCSDSLADYFRRMLENVRRNLPEVARQLKAAGVRRVKIEYDGCGDSGQIESIVYHDAPGQPLDPTNAVGMTEEALKDLFYDLTEARHPGWENSDGAFGEFDWDLAGDTLSHVHSDRFTDYLTTEHEGL